MLCRWPLLNKRSRYEKRGRPQNAFFEACRNLSVRCVITSFYPWGVSRFPVGPLPGYRTSRKEPALPIVRDEFRPAIPRSGWSPPEPVSASPTRASHTLDELDERNYHRTASSGLS